MRAYIFTLLVCLSTLALANETVKKDYNDGPYIQLTTDSLITQWVSDGELQRFATSKTESISFHQPNLPEVEIDPNSGWTTPNKTVYHSDEPIAAISDVHGQYDVFIRLLQAQNIIDSDLQWSFGKGNLVIVGDIMDRGDKVTECLWLIYGLERQAAKAGGKVHFLLGNHELMVMNGNLKYLNKKYYYTSALLQIPYYKLLTPNTLMGQWLASKNVILQINDKLFVHGGLSQQAMSLGLTIDEINKIFKEKIYFKTTKEIEATPELTTLYFEDGPLWYRGYAFPYSFNKNGIDSLLNALKLNHIIVGHTSLPNIKGLYGNRIILIDSSIKLGETGEMLLFDKEFKIGQISGDKIRLISEENKSESRISIFDFLAGKKEVIMAISSKTNEISKNYSKGEAETPGELIVIADQEQFIFSADFKPGGKSRRAICDNPPVKINLKKEELKNFNFLEKFDKLKILFQCNDYKTMAEGIRLEKFIYDLHNIVTPYSHKAKLVKAKMAEMKRPLDGLLLESREDLELRQNIKEIETKTIATEILDREEYVKMCLFQYMIANTDWSARKMHNSKLFQRLGGKSFVAIPYDFDMSGIINNEYAMPSEKLPIKDVTQRYFMDVKITPEELDSGIEYFKTIEKDIMNLCEKVDYIGDNSKKRSKVFIEKFFEIIKDPKQVNRMLKR